MTGIPNDACALNVTQESVNERNDAPYLYETFSSTDKGRLSYHTFISFASLVTDLHAGLLLN